MEVSQQQIKNFVASCIIVQFLCQSARLYYLSTFIDAFRLIGGSCRVTLVVAFGFFPQNFTRRQQPTKYVGALSFYGCRLSGGDFLHSQVVRILNLLATYCPLMPLRQLTQKNLHVKLSQH